MTAAPQSRQARLERWARGGPARQILFYSVNNLGDMLCTTPVVRAFRRAHPEAFLAYVVHNADYCRVLDGNPDLDLVLYREDLSVHGEAIVDEGWLRNLPLPLEEGRELHRFDVQAVEREDAQAYADHISWAFARRHGVTLDSVRPTLELSARERAQAAKLAPRRPYIVLGMHTNSAVHGPKGESTLKDWQLERWLRLAQSIGEWDRFDVLAVGAASDPQIESRHFRNVYGLPIKVTAALLEGAACVVTLEGGLSHICHAVDAPMVLLFSNNVPYAWAYPREATRCRALYDDPRLIAWEDVLAEVEATVGGARAATGADVGEAASRVGRFYDENAEAFGRVYGEVIQAFRTKDVRTLLDYEARAMGLREGMRLLDAGCGVAGPAIHFAQSYGVQVDAVTASEVQAGLARAKVEAAGLGERVRVTRGDYHALDERFEAGGYDVVCFLESFGHSQDKARAIGSAWEALRPGGRLYIKDLFAKEAFSPEHRRAIEANIRRIDEAYRYQVGDLYETLRHLRRRGFLILAVKSIEIPLEEFENLTISNEFQELTGIHRIDDLEGYAFPVDFFELIAMKPAHGIEAGRNRDALQNAYLMAVEGLSPEEL